MNSNRRPPPSWTSYCLTHDEGQGRRGLPSKSGASTTDATLHEMYGGQRQGGISTPKDQPFVLLFTGRSGEQYGYRDGWDENGVFLYTGEGQAGDMEFRGGNRAIRDHAKDGKDLHLFQHLGKNQGFRYLGTFSCSTWEFREGVDQYGNLRRAIVFHLAQSEEDTIADAHAASAP